MMFKHRDARKGNVSSLPSRHLALLEIIVEANAKIVTVDDILLRAHNYCKSKREPYWNFFTDMQDKLYSDDCREDIAYLHQRGYVYVDGEEILLTIRSKNLYEKISGAGFLGFLKKYLL